MATNVKNNVVHMTASLDTYAPSGRIKVKGVRLVAGVDAAVATIRETDASGAVLMVLKAPAAGTEESHIPFFIGVGTFHVTMTGTSPEVFIYLE